MYFPLLYQLAKTMFVAILCVLVVTLILYLYRYFKKSHRYFEKYGIPCTKSHWYYGHMEDAIRCKKSYVMTLKELYEKSEPHRFVGLYTMQRPAVMIRDPELLKSILIKDFDHFHDHGVYYSKEAEPMSHNLFNMAGDEWKNLRIKLTCTFTSGKMKMMFPLVRKCAEDMKPVLNEYSSTPEGFDVKDFCARYTTDVIGSCAFGVDTNSLQNPDSEFRIMGRRIFETRWQGFVRAFFTNIPAWAIKFFGLESIDKKVTDYFTKIIKDMVKFREKNNISRGDFLDILIGMKNRSKHTEKINKDQHEDVDFAKFMDQIGDKFVKNDVEMTLELMAAQCLLFFIGGFEGTSATLTFLLFELSQHPDIQDKLREEIKTIIEKNDGQITYEILNKMPYLDMVIAEILRKYALGAMIRKCTESFKIPESNAVIEKDIVLFISTLGIHHDKKYYEKPDEFYPEHFTKEAINKRPNFAYLPFGDGPRICIGERFAKMQVKLGAVHLLKDFSFELSPKTIVPLEFLPSFSFATNIKGGIWLKCRPL
ncbi:probable cytochrome P450 6a18 [Planococcus citri]|uniref:probable cytochrome P450 6a18 n=1 Tax=Planococcus citri TaxID=170843 RepID=UPI0031F7F1D1